MKTFDRHNRNVWS